MYKEIEKKCIDLTKSLIFKVGILAESINNTLLQNGHLIPDDKREWKYYLNISGEKHYTNSDVKITILENGNEYILTKELLDRFSYSREILKTMSTYYKELIDKYPDDIDFIKGCINPIDKDFAIEATDGTILGYYNNLIERQEINLIPSLEEFIKKALYRWKIDRYAKFENLYVHSILTIIYLNLPAQILNIRLKNINKPFVHTYFMFAFFKSNGLGNEVNYLNKQSRFWLYRNLSYIRKNIGKNYTLDKILDNVFTPNNICISKLELSNKSGFDVAGLPYKEVVVNAKPYNTMCNGKDVELDTIITKELLDKDLINNDDLNLETDLDRLKNELDKLKGNDESSKVVYIQMKNNYTYYQSKLDPIVSHWAYMLKHNILNVFKEFTDPNNFKVTSSGLKVGTIKEYSDPITNMVYKLNAYTAFLVLIKLLLLLDNKGDMKLTDIRYNGIIKADVDIDRLSIYEDGFSREIIKNLNDSLPKMPLTINREVEFKDYLDKYFDFKTKAWLLMSNIQNSSITGNIQLYGNAIEDDGFITIGNNETIDEILLKFDIKYIITQDYDVMLSIKTLVETFTTFQDDNDYYVEESENFKILLKKLTSYTLQPLNQTAEDSVINLYDNNETLFISKNGLITILETAGEPLEDVELVLDSFMEDYVNIVSAYYNRSMPSVCSMEFMKGKTALYDFDVANKIAPINYIVVQGECNYDILDEEWKDEFISGVKIEVLPLEDEINMDSVFGDFISNTAVSVGNGNMPEVSSMKNMSGKYFNYDINNKVIPTNLITVVDEDNYDILDEDFTDIVKEIKPNDVELSNYTLSSTKVVMKFNLPKIEL